MKRFALIMLAVLAVCLPACQEHDMSEEFILDGTVRMDIKGYSTFRYDAFNCQMGFNREKHEFRVHTDNMSDFFMLTLDAMPAAEGQMLEGTAVWTTNDDLHSKKTAFRVVKLEGSKVWLWSPPTRIAIVVEVLD